MVSLNWVTTGGFAILALLCLSVFLGMRRMPSLAWLAATAIAATVQTVFLSDAHEAAASSIAVSVLTPFAYLCFGQSLRVALGQRHQNWGIYAVVAGLIALGIGLKLADVPFVQRTPVFQLSCALALLDSLQRLLAHRGRGAIEWGLVAVVSGVMAIFVFRGATYPLLYPTDISYAALRSGSVESVTLLLSAALSVPAVFLLLARIINGVIVNYRRRSELDGLTGLLNHQAFHQLGEAMSKDGGSVVFCDIDHFKSINDRFGHLAGDRALCAFADLLRGSGYEAGRVGGEEFALIMPGLSTAAAGIEAERLRNRFHTLRHADMPAEQRISASFGVAAYASGQSARTAFGPADEALYAAKRSGRNRVAQHGAVGGTESAAA